MSEAAKVVGSLFSYKPSVGQRVAFTSAEGPLLKGQVVEVLTELGARQALRPRCARRMPSS